MKIKKILCPVDFSNFTNEASQFASIFAAASGAEIIFLHVAPEGSNNSNYQYAMERTREHALSQLVTIRPTVDGIKCSHDVKVCSLVADTIVDCADEHDVDLIVIPTHGRTGLKRLILGSVAEAVLRNAKCPVATIRPGSDFFDQAPASDQPAKSATATEQG